MFIGISQSVLGFLDFIINFVVNLTMWLFKVAFVKIMPVVWQLLGPIIGIVIKIISTLLYAVMMLIFLIMDMLELMFRRISGLESFPGAVTFDGEVVQYGAGEDLVLAFIQTPQIQRIFWMMATVAVVLLLISTIIAIVRTEYADEKTGNGKGPIFGKALKAIALFFTVPIACTAGMMVANLLLKIVDNVTKGSNSIKFSGMVFYAVANSSNRFNSDNFNLAWTLSNTLRGDNTFFSDNQQQPFVNMLRSGSTLTGKNLPAEKILNIKFLDAMTAGKVLEFQVDENRAAMAAEIINTAFKYQIVHGDVTYNQGLKEWVGEIGESGQAYDLCTKLKQFTFGSGPYTEIKQQAINGAMALGLDSSFKDTMDMQMSQALTHTSTVVGSGIAKGFTVYNIELVFYFYDSIIFNYILGVLIGTTVLKVLLDLCMGCVVRLYKLVTLYAISPAIIALMPLDEKPFQQWTKKFVGLVTGLYGGVVALNMFFMISPLVYKINFFNDIQTGAQNPDLRMLPALTNPMFIKALNYLPQMMMVAAGAVSIRGISEMISQLIGAEDTMKEGAGATGQVTSAIKGAASLAMGPAAMAAKLAAKTASTAGGAAMGVADGLSGGKASEGLKNVLHGKVGADGERSGGLAGAIKNPLNTAGKLAGGAVGGAIALGGKGIVAAKDGIMKVGTGMNKGERQQVAADKAQDKEQAREDRRTEKVLGGMSEMRDGQLMAKKGREANFAALGGPDALNSARDRQEARGQLKGKGESSGAAAVNSIASGISKERTQSTGSQATTGGTDSAQKQKANIGSDGGGGGSNAQKIETVVKQEKSVAKGAETAGVNLVKGRLGDLTTQKEKDRQDDKAKWMRSNTMEQRRAEVANDSAHLETLRKAREERQREEKKQREANQEEIRKIKQLIARQNGN